MSIEIYNQNAPIFELILKNILIDCIKSETVRVRKISSNNNNTGVQFYPSYVDPINLNNINNYHHKPQIQQQMIQSVLYGEIQVMNFQTQAIPQAKNITDLPQHLSIPVVKMVCNF